MLHRLRPRAARWLLPALALHLALPFAAWADVTPSTSDGLHELQPQGPNSNRQRLSPGGPNSNRQRLNPGGPNSNRQRLNPGGPNSNRQRLNPGGPNSNRQRFRDHLGEPGRSERRDREETRSFEWTAPNGILARVEAYPDGHGAMAASAVLRSASGEELTVDFLAAGDAGPVALIDGEILVAYRVASDGRVTEVVADDGFRAAKTRRHRRPSRAEHDAYSVLIGALSERHSPDFLAQSRRALETLESQAVAPATLRFTLECSLGILGYLSSIAGLISGCTAGAAVTLGSTCGLAILAHEISVASGVLACAE